MKKVSISTFKLARTLLEKADMELIIDEYEVTIVDCNQEKHSNGESGFVLSCQTHNQKEMDKLYFQAMEIYSERIKAMGVEKKIKSEEDNADLIEEALASLKKYLKEIGE